MLPWALYWWSLFSFVQVDRRLAVSAGVYSRAPKCECLCPGLAVQTVLTGFLIAFFFSVQVFLK